jgi:hypothetical protein
VTGFAAGFFFLAAVLLAVLWQRTRVRLRDAAAARAIAEQNGFSLAAVLATVPVFGGLATASRRRSALRMRPERR